MKKSYETPEMEIFKFETTDAVMDNDGDCSGFECPDGICVVDGVCPDFDLSSV